MLGLKIFVPVQTSCLCTTSATLFSNANFGHLSWTFLILFEHFFLGYLDQKKTLSRQNKTPSTYGVMSKPAEILSPNFLVMMSCAIVGGTNIGRRAKANPMQIGRRVV